MIQETLEFKSCSFSKSKENWTVAVFNTVSEIIWDDWNELVNHNNVYLSREYLTSLEETMSSEMSFCYALIKDEKGEIVVLQYFQIVLFSDFRKSFTSVLINKLRGNFRNSRDGFHTDVLVCGNVFCNGENGLIIGNTNDHAKVMNAIGQVADIVVRNNQTTKKTSIVLLKDFWPNSEINSKTLEDFGFQEFMIDVNMVLKIHPEWKTMDDYLSVMKTKYRTRAKSVFKKANAIEIKDLSHSDIIEHKSTLQELFNNVQARSEYKMGTISANTFARFKQSMPNNYLLKAAFFEDKIVGFSTSFINGYVLEPNYVGIDYSFNKDMAVYQFLLYDLVQVCMDRNLKELHLGRTSELVKSAMGATPVNMKLYGKHKSKMTNLLVKAVLKRISPAEFELRQPFKENFRKIWTP